MRNIPAPALAKLATDKGTEPLVVLEVQWTGVASTAAYYADKTLAGTPVQGRILELPGLDEIVQVSGGGQAQQLNVVLDDHDGAIKALAFDKLDPHKKTVKVWQYVEGTNFATDKFLLFRGQINSLVSWDEGQRTVSLTIMSRIEDVEVGFSAEEGNFPRIPEDLIGKPWPLCFGTVVHVPALKAVPAVNGRLATGVGIKDFTIARRLELAEAITCPQTPVGFKCSGSASISNTINCDIAYEQDMQCLQSKCMEVERLKLQYAEQSSYEYTVIRIFDGENFPQGKTITLNINGGKFTGKFQGTKAEPSNLFTIIGRTHPKDDGTGNLILDPLEEQVKSLCPSAAEEAGDSDTAPTAWGEVPTGLRTSRLSWEAYQQAKEAGFFWAGGGSTVTLDQGNEIVYIANLLPSTILRVAAWRTINGNRFLLTVPQEFYNLRETNYGGYQVVEIVFDRPLSVEQHDTGGGWSDDIYVSLTSSVGPNTVDILRWFVEKYTSYGIDASFDTVKPKLTKYPMHFALLHRENLLSILQKIARLARCALWMKDDTFYLKYLSEEPTPVAEIGEDDILQGTFRIELTKTEDLVTKYTAKWRRDYSAERDNTLILRHNIKAYGTHEQTEDYFAFNILDLVRKSATYWLIRWCHTWKVVKFSTSLEFLNLEPFDAVTLDLPDVADNPFIGIVERATYDSDARQINFEIWTPILAGTRAPYNFAWPAAISENALFPSALDRALGKAGSGTEPNFSSIAPPGHPLRTEQTGIFSGFALRCNGSVVTNSATGECRPDHGDSRPSDIGDQTPRIQVVSDTTGNVSGGTSPVTNGAGTGYGSHVYQMNQKTNDATSGAYKGREQAQRAVDAGNADGSFSSGEMRDFLKKLPKPEDLTPEKHPCQVRVVISGFKLTTVLIGGNPVCFSSTGTFQETLVFNSCTAAQAFKAGFAGQKNCATTFPCTRCVSVTITNCGCEPKPGEPPAIIAYENSLGNDSSSFFD